MKSKDYSKAMKQYKKIAQKYDLNPRILKDVIEGRMRGLSQQEITETYGYHRNTVYKYNKKVKDEFDEADLKDLIALMGILIGTAKVLDEIFGEG